MFADGTLTMGLEAMDVLQQAASRAHAVTNGYRFAVLSELQTMVIRNEPTGTVSFRNHPFATGQAAHGIVIDQVRPGTSKPVVLCATGSGGQTPHTHRPTCRTTG